MLFGLFSSLFKINHNSRLQIVYVQDEAPERVCYLFVCSEQSSIDGISVPRFLTGGKGVEWHAHFITSLSDGSSEKISCVMRSRCLGDIRGKGAEFSSPKMGRISRRMSIPSFVSIGEG